MLAKRAASPTQITDALSRISRIAYDPDGNPTSVTNPANEQTRFSYTAQGLLSSVTDALDHTNTLSYDTQGNLTRAVDALNRASKFSYDDANRLTRTTNPLNQSRNLDYDSLDRITQSTDPISGATRYSYDANDNLLSVTDPLNHAVESYSYDLLGRVTRITDAAGLSRSYQYDANSNLTQSSDRAGRLTRHTYDAANRRTRSEDADGRITEYRYDLAGNLSHIHDTQGGDLLMQYDLLDRLTQIATDQGTVGYEYDALSRRTKRTINGADPTDYGYDTAGRLSSIAFRGNTVRYTWDAAGRLTGKTLPNGIVQTHSYDNANQLTRISYSKPGGGTLETLNYSYDAAGRRTARADSQASLQDLGFSAAYDTSNRLTTLTLTSGTIYDLGYDAHGQLISKTRRNSTDRTDYVWDARQQLRSITGPGINASFAYDALGRRTSKTVNGVTTGYLYDGSQAIAELNGYSIAAAYHTGLAIDEVLAVYANSGNRTLLQDALGSVIASTDNNASTTGTYRYSSYGETAASNPTDPNSLQYTGRENDAPVLSGVEGGLYYYRARYYDPLLKRFISEDPIGMAGGDANFYSFVGGDPVSRIDPLGLQDGQLSSGDMRAIMNEHMGQEVHNMSEAAKQIATKAGQCVGCFAKAIVGNVAEDTIVKAALGPLARYGAPEISVPVTLIYAAYEKGPYKTLKDLYDAADAVKQCAAQ